MARTSGSGPSPRAPSSKPSPSQLHPLDDSDQVTKWEFQTPHRERWVVAENPEVQTEAVMVKLVGESDVLDRLEGLICGYFAEDMVELVSLLAQKAMGRPGMRLDQKVAIELAKRVLFDLVEHDRQWAAEIKGARRKAIKEARAKERVREQDREEDRRRRYID